MHDRVAGSGIRGKGKGKRRVRKRKSEHDAVEEASRERARIRPEGDTRRPRVLFISRKHPPSVGGMERLSHELVTHMRKRLPCSAITWGHSQAYLPFFLPVALSRAAFSLATGSYDMIHIGDALLSPLGLFLKRLSGRPVAVNLHGLDLTFPNRLYQRAIRAALPGLDLFICISRQARDIAVGMGIPSEKTRIIPCGIVVEGRKTPPDRRIAREELTRVLGRELRGKALILTVGRLVKRKGVLRFIGEILPRVADRFPDLFYLVVGEGEEDRAIRQEIARGKLEDHVVLIGRVSEEALEMAYRASDIFVMPNIRVEGDMEGFGIVAIEAALRGLPVVASAVEGICDAVIDGQNGILVHSEDPGAFAAAVMDLLGDEGRRERIGRQGRDFTEREFGWERIAQQYHENFSSCSGIPAPDYRIIGEAGSI